METTRLLLVDDDPDNLEVLTIILGEKFDVFGYGNAQDALTALEVVKPHVVLLDIGMAPVDGLQCLAAIRAVRGCGGIPAIALTAYARDVDREAFLAAGFQAVVTKPVLEHRELFAAITPLVDAGEDPQSGDPAVEQCGVGRRLLTRPTDDGDTAECGAGQPSRIGRAK